MGNLPPEKTRVPLCSLAIPGKNQRERTPKSHRRNIDVTRLLEGIKCLVLIRSILKVEQFGRFTTSWTFFDAFRIKKNNADT